MKPYWIWALLITVSGCEKPPAAATPPPSAGHEIGRFAVSSAGGNDHSPGTDLFSAWRIDTKTGDLEFCTYTVVTSSNGPPTEIAGCSKPAKGPQSN
jgi:hypothetical protein